ncbi:hypothetical protein NQZ68_027630 [Dissostichus eleginoides]|nr:hypothetical protein NQZ68_027630 [Dissostichus eleginoides]
MTRFSKAKGLYSVGACSRDPVCSAGSRGAMAAFKGTAGLREDRDAGMGQALNLLLSCSLIVGGLPGPRAAVFAATAAP